MTCSETQVSSTNATCRATGITVESVGGELLILDKVEGQIHHLNDTAGIVWTGLERRMSADQIASILTERFDVDRAEARQDTMNLISQLEQLKLAERSGSEY